MSETTRVRRSPQEILAAKEADLVNAKARAAVDAQMSNPTVQALTSKLADISKSRTDAKKGYNGNPSQTFANRLESHKLWIAEVEADKDLADAQIALADYIGPKYRELRTEVATFLANGGDAGEATMMVENGTDAILEAASGLFQEVADAEANLAVQVAARKAFVEGKKTGKAQATQVATA